MSMTMVDMADGGGGGSISSNIHAARIYLEKAQEEAKKLTSDLMSDSYYTVGVLKDNLDTELSKLSEILDTLEEKDVTRKNYRL